LGGEWIVEIENRQVKPVKVDWKELEWVKNQEFTVRTKKKKERDSVKRGRK